MTVSRQLTPDTLFSTEYECVTYLFNKRWPRGFVCPFCNRLQKETAPAYSVVCRYCRKQTSITAHTVMHGSKNSLISWMLVAWQFCSRDQGISAREIQRRMALSSYQTAWTWLRKIRRGAALAESAPCSGIVTFDMVPLALSPSIKKREAAVGIARETPCPENKVKRIRFSLLESGSLQEVSTVITKLVKRDSTLLIDDAVKPSTLLPEYLCRQSNSTQHPQAEQLAVEAASWLSSTYRRCIDSDYLQSYLDEFSFRYNTSAWPNKLMVFEHLLSGLLTSDNSGLSQQTLSGEEK